MVMCSALLCALDQVIMVMMWCALDQVMVMVIMMWCALDQVMDGIDVVCSTAGYGL